MQILLVLILLTLWFGSSAVLSVLDAALWIYMAAMLFFILWLGSGYFIDLVATSIRNYFNKISNFAIKIFQLKFKDILKIIQLLIAREKILIKSFVKLTCNVLLIYFIIYLFGTL